MAHYVPQLEPIEVPKVETRYRRIVTPLPVPESIPIFETLQRHEPRSMGTQVPIVWDRAEGFQVYDPYGNCWIDFTSGILVANSGHGHPHICEALRRQTDGRMLHAYLFATEVRAKLVEKLVEITPPNLTKVFLLTTGSEAIEAALKIARLHGMKIDPNKCGIISFTGAFHGRTMGSQMLCSSPDHKDWITHPDPDINQIPFPRCHECPWDKSGYENCGGECFEKGLTQLGEKGVDVDRTAAFVVEGYQGIRGPIFYPVDYIKALRRWADGHKALMIVDEIQSGFGRTGRLFAYEHYEVEADLVCCGKGISSSLPLSAVLGRAEIMDIPEPGYMTSTHTGNPACCAATLASIEVLINEQLVSKAAEKGHIVEAKFAEFRNRHPDRLAMSTGRGLVHSVFFVRPGTDDPDIELADRVVNRSIQKGVMLFITGNGTIKVCPPLMISEEALVEGMDVLGEALDECLNEGQV